MRRKTLFLVLAAVLVASVADAGMFRRRSASGNMFPDTGDLEGLVRTGKVVTYKNENLADFYGTAGNRYIQYGIINLMTGEYTYGAKDRRVTVELATMDSSSAAAGLYHHHRGVVMGGRGDAVPVGTEGVLDTGREGRTLYFYRGSIFVKIIYSGKEPVPSLVPLAELINSRLPAGDDARPAGFDYIEIPGIAKESIALTPGFTFNYSFLPPAVWASAPGGGSVASDLFIITQINDRNAADLYKDYLAYLKLHAEYVEEYSRGGKRRYTKAVDPAQGRVVFTAYRNALIIAARPDGYEKGEALIDKVMEKIEEVNPGKKRK